MKFYVDNELTKPFILHKYTGHSILDIIKTAKTKPVFKLGNITVSTFKNRISQNLIAEKGDIAYKGNTMQIAKKIGVSVTSIGAVLREGKAVINGWKLEQVRKTQIKCLWNVSVKHIDLTYAEAKQIVDNPNYTFGNDKGFVNGWIYDKKRVILDHNIGMYCKYYVKFEDYYIFGTLKGLNRKLNTGICDASLNDLMNKEGIYQRKEYTIYKGY